jgi:hypothetical protein
MDTDTVERSSREPMPRWVKVFGFIFLALLVVVVVMHVTGNSLGGPGSHGRHEPPAAAPHGGHR